MRTGRRSILCEEEYGLELDLEQVQKMRMEVQECQIEKLEDDGRNQRWRGHLVTIRLEDESLSTNECFWWLTEWKNCPSHTIPVPRQPGEAT